MAGRHIGPHGRDIENDFISFPPGVTTLNTFNGIVQIVPGLNTTVSSPQPGWIAIDVAATSAVLTDGSGTTGNGSAIDLGGTLTTDANFTTGSYRFNINGKTFHYDSVNSRVELFAGTNNTGFATIFAGNQSGENNTGVFSVGYGYLSGTQNTGDYFTGLGCIAGQNNTGVNFTGVGYNSGGNNTGTNFIGLGHSAGVANDYNNVVVLGYNSTATAANQFVVKAGTYNTRFNTIGMTADRLYTLPNASGTIALTSQILPLINGSGTTANGMAVNLGGTATGNIALNLATFSCTISGGELVMDSDGNANGSSQAIRFNGHGATANSQTATIYLDAFGGVNGHEMNINCAGVTLAVGANGLRMSNGTFASVATAGMLLNAASLTNGFLLDQGYNQTSGDVFRLRTQVATTPVNLFSISYDGKVTISKLATGLTAPTTTGTVKMMVTDANGLISFLDVPTAAVATLPGGNNKDIQFNNSSAFGGATGFTYDPTTHTYGVVELSYTDLTKDVFTILGSNSSVSLFSIRNVSNPTTGRYFEVTPTGGFMGGDWIMSNGGKLSMSTSAAGVQDFITLTNNASSTRTYKLTLSDANIFSIKDNVANQNRLSIDATGNLIIRNLTSSFTAPTTSGTTKMVITDANGLLSFIPLPATPTFQQVLTSGSVLTQNNTLTLNSNQLDINGSSSIHTLHITNSANGMPLIIDANTGPGLYVTSSSSYAVAIFRHANGDSGVQSVIDIERFIYPCPTGTGAAIDFDMLGGDDGNQFISNRIISVWSDSTGTLTPTSQFEIWGRASGDLSAEGTRKMAIKGNGGLILDGYGSGANTGTPVFPLSVDVNGNVIEDLIHTLNLSVVYKNASYTIDPLTDYTIVCETNTFTVTLPPVVGIEGQIFNIKNLSAGTITILPDNGSEYIDDVTSVLIERPTNITVQATNTGWVIL